MKRRSFLKFTAAIVFAPLSVLKVVTAPLTETEIREKLLLDYMGFGGMEPGYIYCPYIPVTDENFVTSFRPYTPPKDKGNWGKITSWA